MHRRVSTNKNVPSARTLRASTNSSSVICTTLLRPPILAELDWESLLSSAVLLPSPLMLQRSQRRLHPFNVLSAKAQVPFLSPSGNTRVATRDGAAQLVSFLYTGSSQRALPGSSFGPAGGSRSLGLLG